MRFVRLATLYAVLLSLLFVGAAFAQDTNVEIGWGDVLVPIIGLVGLALTVLVGVAITFALQFLPPWARAVVGTKELERIQALAADAIEMGVQKTQNAVKGQEISINVGSEVVANAAQHWIDTGEKALIDTLGTQGVKDAVIKGLETANVILPANSTAGQILADPKVKAVKNP